MTGSSGAGWVAIVGWDEHVHYSDRAPVWIKLPVRLMADDAFLELTPARCSILCRLLLEYASSSCRLRADTRSLSRRLAQRVTTADLEALVQAGFIAIVASSSLASGYHAASPHATRGEKRRGEETRAVTPTSPLAREAATGTAQDEQNGTSSAERRLEAALPLKSRPPRSSSTAAADAIERMRPRLRPIE